MDRKSKDDHQKKVCEAALAVMSARKGKNLHIVSSPDKNVRNKPAVDYVASDGDERVVVEHTRLESFPEQVSDDHRVRTFFETIERNLKGKLSHTGGYFLYIAPHSLKGVRNPEEVRKGVEDWVYQTAPQLTVGRPGSTGHFRTEQPPNVPFEVTLSRMEGFDGMFSCARSLPEELERKRNTRMRSALDSKCPKLLEAKREAGESVSSMLVVESSDLALANHVLIAKQLIPEVVSRGDSPDNIYLVDTTAKPWRVILLKEGSDFFPSIQGGAVHQA